MTKLEMLKLVRDKVCKCTKCPELVASRTQIVFNNINYEEDCQLGKGGNPNSKVMLLGEAPGEDEDKEGEAFVGKAGQLLTNILKAVGVGRDEVYICNILKCRPPNNRVPKPEEAKNCEPYLKAQIKIINPKLIICMGASAMKYLLKIDQPVGHIRGKWFDYEDAHVKAKVTVTYHPSYGLRAGDKAKEAIFEDLEAALDAL